MLPADCEVDVVAVEAVVVLAELASLPLTVGSKMITGALPLEATVLPLETTIGSGGGADRDVMSFEVAGR